MDKYKTRRGDWFRLGKDGEEAVSEYQGSASTANTTGAVNDSRGGSAKSAIQVRIRLCLRFAMWQLGNYHVAPPPAQLPLRNLLMHKYVVVLLPFASSRLPEG